MCYSNTLLEEKEDDISGEKLSFDLTKHTLYRLTIKYLTIGITRVHGRQITQCTLVIQFDKYDLHLGSFFA